MMMPLVYQLYQSPAPPVLAGHFCCLQLAAGDRRSRPSAGDHGERRAATAWRCEDGVENDVEHDFGTCLEHGKMPNYLNVIYSYLFYIYSIPIIFKDSLWRSIWVAMRLFFQESRWWTWFGLTWAVIGMIVPERGDFDSTYGGWMKRTLGISILVSGQGCCIDFLA